MVNFVTIQNSLAAGELSPTLYGRTDLQKWNAGTSTCRNFYVDYRGGVSSRAGLAYVGTCLQPGDSDPPKDIPFQFSITQGYALEFGDQYMRIKVDGAYVLEDPVTLTSVSSSALFTTSAPHGFIVGDWVFDEDNEDFSGLTWIIHTTPTTSTFTVTDLFGNVIPASASSSGGTVSRIYTVDSPYSAIDLPFLKYVQSADVMTLCCVNQETGTEYPSYQLVRNDNTDWVFSVETFAVSISPPSGLTVSAVSSTTPSAWYSYTVTAVDRDTGEESVASAIASIFNNDISVNAGSNILTWSAVANSKSYNVYATIPSYGYEPPVSSIFGFIGIATGPGFVDTNILPDFSLAPPLHEDPFAVGAIQDIVPTAGGVNYSQTTVGYSITTSTGSGFTGYPVVENSTFKGFFITNHGKNYVDTDTITITDSGGGTATGYFNFTVNPADKTSITVNGIVFEFVDEQEGTSNQQISFGSTLAITLSNTANFLNSCRFASIQVATYSATATRINIRYKTHGSVGNAFTLANGGGTGTPVAGLSVSGATLTGGGTAGTGATATLTVGPQDGTFPSVPAYFQQRRVYANSLNNPDTYWMSRPGLYNNFDVTIPTVDDDSITGTPWAQQVNGIQWLVPMPGGLVTLTGKSAWQVNGGGQAGTPITPSDQSATQQAFNGCDNKVQPLQVNYDILYVQSKGNIVRDLAYNFFINIYTGTDLTTLSNHLFVNSQIKQWTWAEEPFKLVWAVKTDGGLLCLTYLKEQEVYAWTRHDTNGLFVSVCSITESSNPDATIGVAPLVDAVYVITKRYIQGGWRYYSERMDNRLWRNVEDTFAVDSGLAYPLTYPDATLSAQSCSPKYNDEGPVLFTASSSVFTADNVGDIIRIGGGKAEVIEYVSVSAGTQVWCSILEEIVNVRPNDPGRTPLPALPGFWTISTPTSVLSGLNHLEGMEVAILADGSVVPNQCVRLGQITLPADASKIAVGLPYTCQVQTLYADAPDGPSTVQNRRKLISSAGIRVAASRGLQIGTDQPDQSVYSNDPTEPVWSNMSEVKERTMFVDAGTAVPLFTGDYFKNVSSNWSMKGQLAVQQIYPLPANIMSIIIYWTVGDN